MRSRMQAAPWWVWSLVMGLYFAAVLAVFGLSQRPQGVLPTIVGALVGGGLFGGFMGPYLVRQRDSARVAMSPSGSDGLDETRSSEAIRAASRGGIPRDPVVREAAARLVRYRLALAADQRRWAIPMFVVLIGVAVVLALLMTLLWWLAVVLFGAALVSIVVQPRRMAARLRQLETGS
ncbi:hypothetical protein [Lapillicoccus sp.]|uniref:hypothetical protein n=1 Tax=Lapillicoccus sp. TaxID=1909287 RepID=UPI0025E5CB67|nr:hypothetical protein [Lapillicoccus sp.]